MHGDTDAVNPGRGRGVSPGRHGLVLLLCFMMFLIVCRLYLDQYIEIRKLESRLDEKNGRLEEESARLERLRREVAFLGTLEGIEKLARERLKYIKKDEIIVIPLDDGFGGGEGSPE